MKKELKNFTIESNSNLEYFDDIVNYILKTEKIVFNYFKIQKIFPKYKIIIMDYAPFKEYLLKQEGKIYNYIRGITEGQTIRILNIEDQIKYTTHKDSTLEDTKKMIMHELVHMCHHFVNDDYNQTIWFREGLATNLSNQNYKKIDLSTCNFELLKNDFYKFGKNNYSCSWTIVNYILNNYDDEEIRKLINDSDYLRKNADRLYEEAKESVKKTSQNKVKKK